MAQNKVVYYGDTLIDLTGDTVSDDKVLNGYVYHKPDGSQSVGTFVPESGSAIVVTEEQDEHGGVIKHIVAVDLSGDTVTPATLQNGVTAHNSQGRAITGTYTPGTPTILLQSKTATPTETAQTITADTGYDGLSSVAVSAISSTYVGSDITRNPALTVSGDTVTAPAGYYSQAKSASVTTVTQATPSVTVSNTGLITATATQTEGYVEAGTKTGTRQLTTQAAKTVTPTKSSQQAVASGVYTTGAVTVAAIPNDYIIPTGSQTITSNGTVDVTAQASVTVDVEGGGQVSGDKLLLAEGTYDVSDKATATYIYPMLYRAYINTGNDYWGFYNDSSTSFCFDVEYGKTYTLMWDSTMSGSMYRMAFVKTTYGPSYNSNTANRRTTYDSAGNQGIEFNDPDNLPSYTFTVTDAEIKMCVIQISGDSAKWNNGQIQAWFKEKMTHFTIIIE